MIFAVLLSQNVRGTAEPSELVASEESAALEQASAVRHQSDIRVEIYHNVLNKNILENAFVKWNEDMTLADVLDILVLDGYLTGSDYSGFHINGIEMDNITYLNGDYGEDSRWVCKINGLEVLFSIESIVINPNDNIEINFVNIEDYDKSDEGDEGGGSDSEGEASKEEALGASEQAVNSEPEILSSENSKASYVFGIIPPDGLGALIFVAAFVSLLIIITAFLIIKKKKSFINILESTEEKSQDDDFETDGTDDE